jgi:hypothetical protein
MTNTIAANADPTASTSVVVIAAHDAGGLQIAQAR